MLKLCQFFLICLLYSFFFVQFGELGGFTAIQSKLNTDEIEIAVSVTSFLSRLCPPYNSSDVSFRVMK